MIRDFRDLIGVVYYATIWPLRSIAGQLVDNALVRIGVKYRQATGPAKWRFR